MGMQAACSAFHDYFRFDKTKKTLKNQDLFSGPEGSRTPVRKPIHRGISHHSRLFDIPSAVHQPAGLQLQ